MTLKKQVSPLFVSGDYENILISFCPVPLNPVVIFLQQLTVFSTLPQINKAVL
jgi:hypothetical protein